jgi:hypothetical protein
VEIRSAVTSPYQSLVRLRDALGGSVPVEQAGKGGSGEAGPAEPKAAEASGQQAGTASDAASVDLNLTPDEQIELDLLEQRDTEVRAHEQAHVAAGGQYVTGSPTYSYQTGPDGQRYAIGGEVGIDTAPISGDPAASLQKARVIQRAALAPAEPSAQDLQVAASARELEMDAVQQLSELQGAVLAAPLAGSKPESTGEGSSEETAREPVQTSGSPAVTSARSRLEQRISALFAAPPAHRLSEQA